MADIRVDPPPLNSRAVDNDGFFTREAATYLHRLWKRTSDPSGNVVDETVTAAGSAQNAADSAAASAAAAQESADDAQSTADTVVSDFNDHKDADSAHGADGDVVGENTLNTHTGASSAHGSNGDIVGFSDVATELAFGLVKMADFIADASNTTASTVSTVASAPATYDQTYTDTLATAINANVASINQLITDYDALVAKYNDLLDKVQAAGQMNTS